MIVKYIEQFALFTFLSSALVSGVCCCDDPDEWWCCCCCCIIAGDDDDPYWLHCFDDMAIDALTGDCIDKWLLCIDIFESFIKWWLAGDMCSEEAATAAAAAAAAAVRSSTFAYGPFRTGGILLTLFPVSQYETHTQYFFVNTNCCHTSKNVKTEISN